MLAATGAKLCLECHDNPATGHKVQHPPVEEGECTSCHSPHAGKARGMLVESGAALCEQCHDSKTAGKKNLHPPVAEGDCVSCHGVHGGAAKALLPATGTALCAECHDDIVEAAAKAKYPHAAVEDGCTSCHDVHGTGFPKMLSAKGGEVCYECHDDMAEKVKNAKFGHAPVEDGECVACHNPHGSKYRSLLVAAYPEEIYVVYEEQQYALCYQCHDPLLARYDQTDVTNFRNGHQSLHWLHVNRSKGRTCRVCHDIHGSEQKHLLNPFSPNFGRWNIPLQFIEHNGGGACMVGCHKPKMYDRQNGIKNP